MNYKLRFKPYIITEALTDKVYHYTDIAKLLKIVSENRFYLAPAFNSADDNHDVRQYYMSTTRNKAAVEGFAYSKAQRGLTARIEFDGRTLNSNFKGKPYDYWGSSMGKRSYYKNNEWNKDKQHHTTVEAEDRLMSYEPVIDNISKYIVRIDVLLPLEPLEDAAQNEGSEYARNILSCVSNILDNSQDFNLFFYDNIEDFNRQTDRTINENVISICETYKGNTSENGLGGRVHLSDMVEVALFLVMGETHPNKYKEEVLSLFQQYDLSKYINDSFDKSLSEAMSLNIRELCRSIVELFERLKKTPSQESSVAMKMVTDYMRKHNFKSIYDIVEYKEHAEYGFPKSDDLYSSDKEMTFYVWRRYSSDLGSIILNPSKMPFMELIGDRYDNLESFANDATYCIFQARGDYSSGETPERIEHFILKELKKRKNALDCYSFIKQMCRGDNELLSSIFSDGGLSLESLTFPQAINKVPYNDNKFKNQIIYLYRKGR